MKYKQIGGASKVWDPDKQKYVKKSKKKEQKEIKWVHKNNYVRTRFGLMKGENTPYRKPEENQEEEKQ